MSKPMRIWQKKETKMSLRQNSRAKPKKLVEYDSDEEEKHIQSKSRKWWQRVNRKYFKDMSLSQYSHLRSLFSEQQLITTESNSLKLSSYFGSNILPKNPRLFERKNLKVVFQQNTSGQREGKCTLVSYYFTVPGSMKIEEQNSKQQPLDSQKEEGFQSQPINEFKQNQNLRKINLNEEGLGVYYLKSLMETNCYDQFSESEINEIQMIYRRSSNDIDFVTDCLYYDWWQGKHRDEEVDHEIELWEREYDKIEGVNSSIWKQIGNNIEKEQESLSHDSMHQKILNGYQIQEDEQKIQQYLRWQNVLLGFKNGFMDKTEEMLAEALQSMWMKENMGKDAAQRKKIFKTSTLESLIVTKSQLVSTFETDCKVCFHNYCSSVNKVIYCDSCNESFHENCYGLSNVDTDVENKFFCDFCLELERRGLKKSKHHVLGFNKTPNKYSISCEICFVEFGPLKMLEGHFYHPSCLMVNNFVRPQIGKMELREQITHQGIQEMVSKSETVNENCRYCCQGSEKGLRFSCCQEGCNKAFHFICGYLNSVIIDIKRNQSVLEVSVRCPQHFEERDYHRQSYLRRFFCNYRNTSDLTEAQFIEMYREELRDYQLYSDAPSLYSKYRQQEKKRKQKCTIKKQTKCLSSSASQAQTVVTETSPVLLSSDSEDLKMMDCTDRNSSTKQEPRRDQKRKHKGDPFDGLVLFSSPSQSLLKENLTQNRGLNQKVICLESSRDSESL